MGWSIGWDPTWNRDIGYGVPAWCDHPDCPNLIDRGLAYVCGSDPLGGDEGCGLYFCIDHRFWKPSEVNPWRPIQVCEACRDQVQPFPARPDHPIWLRHKLTDPSWKNWRDENPDQVQAMVRALAS